MDFHLTKEQQLVRKMYREFAENEVKPLAAEIDEEERFPKPDLIIIDGGKGQLSAIKEIFDEAGITDIELISLAEKEEEIFILIIII